MAYLDDLAAVEGQTFTYMWSRIFVGYDAISGLFTFTFKWRSETPEQGAVGWLFLYVFDKSYICVWQISYLYLTNFVLVFDKFYICIWPISYLYLTNIIFVLDKYYICTCTCISKRLRLGSWGSWARQENISYVWLDPESALLCIHVLMLHVAFFMLLFMWTNIAMYEVRNRQHFHFIPPLENFQKNIRFGAGIRPNQETNSQFFVPIESGIYRGSSHT